MSSPHSKMDFYRMSTGMLQQKLDSCIRLKTQRAHLLPDGGKKLDDAIDLIHSILVRKKCVLSPELHPVPITKTSSIKSYTQNNMRMSAEEVDESGGEDLVDITSALRSLDIKDDGIEFENEDLSKFPDDPLSQQEIDQFIAMCNLPPNCCSDQVCCHPFAFLLDLIGPDCVCLRVVDCLNLGNTFTRYGTPSVWNTKFKVSKNEAKDDCFCEISHPGSAVKDLWLFVRKAMANVKYWPVFVFHSEESLRNFRALFCTSSVQHYPGAKYIPLSCRFVVREMAESFIAREFVQEANRQPGAINESDDGLAALAESFSREHMTALALRKMKPKSVAWLKAPLNYRAFLHISKIPTDVVTSIPPYLPSALLKVSVDRPYEPQTATVPILSSFEDSFLQHLAVTGFIPQTLSLLAAKGGWRGFAGLLSALGISKASPEPLANLYRGFTKVNRGLAINADLYKEDAKKASIKDLWNEVPRKLKFLCEPPPMHSELPEDKIRITMPPATDKLLRYREDRLDDSDDSLDPEVDDCI